MGLQVAMGGVRVGRGSMTERTFYCRVHGRVHHGDQAARPALDDCPSCQSFLNPAPRLGYAERKAIVAAKWGLDKGSF